MSWGNTASGTAAQVKGTAGTFASTVAENDAKYGAGPRISAAHQAQARGVEGMIGGIVDAAPDGSTFSISVSASAPESSGTGYVNLGYSISVPTQASVPAADGGEGPEA